MSLAVRMETLLYLRFGLKGNKGGAVCLRDVLSGAGLFNETANENDKNLS